MNISRPLFANTLMEYGFLLEELNDVPGAKESFTEALAIFSALNRESKAPDIQMLASEGRSRFGVGKCLHQEKQFEEALEMYEGALETTRSAFTEKHYNCAEIYRTMGALHSDSGDRENASICYRTSLSILKEIEHPARFAVLKEYIHVTRSSSAITAEADRVFEKAEKEADILVDYLERKESETANK